MKLAKLIILFIFSSVSVFGQITFSAPNLKVRKGDTVDVEIKMNSKDTISYISFTLNWDSTVVAYQRIKNFNLPANTVDTFGYTKVKQGELKFQWLGADPYAIKDSIIIFKLSFVIKGDKGTTSNLKFLKSSAYDDNVVDIPVTIQNGILTVDMTNSTKPIETLQNYAQLNNVQPNPILNKAIFPFQINEKDEITFIIYSIDGKIIHTQKRQFDAGSHFFELNTEGVLTSGLYMYSIQTKRGFLSKKLIKK